MREEIFYAASESNPIAAEGEHSPEDGCRTVNIKLAGVLYQVSFHNRSLLISTEDNRAMQRLVMTPIAANMIRVRSEPL